MSQRQNIGDPVVCGYYRLYFEQFSGFENGVPDVIARRNVLCQVFTDISNFIDSPLNADGNISTEKVNIWVRAINKVKPSAGTSTIAGLASCFYNVPKSIQGGNNGLNLFGGILDGEVWKTIHTGIDSYKNVMQPLVTPNDPAHPDKSYFYYGCLAINFFNSNLSWNYDLNNNNLLGPKIDLYSVLLHEITHMLGFRTLLGVDKKSIFPAGYDYFSRYDTFLSANSNNNFVLSSPSGLPMYDALYNNSSFPTLLQPSGGCPTVAPVIPTNITDCSVSRLLFSLGSAATDIVPVFRPDCYQPESSLSHFEDDPSCFIHTPSTTNDGYFLMSNGINTGSTKRFMQAEERLALCRIGYQVKGVFGNTLNNNLYNYIPSSTCEGITVSGINDGFLAPTATLPTQLAYSYTIGDPPLVINDFLNNDIGASAAEGIQNVYQANSVIGITNFTPTSFSFTSTTVGVALIRYVPINAQGQRGNITYIYVRVLPNNNCITPTCNLVTNGGFEQVTAPLPISFHPLWKACNWFDAQGGSADLCNLQTIPAYLIPSVPMPLSGNNVVGIAADLYETSSRSYKFREVIGTDLKTPLQPNTDYTLTFSVYLSNFSNETTALQALFTSYFINGIYNYEEDIPEVVGQEILLTNPSQNTYGNGWQLVTFTFNTGNITGLKYLYLGRIRNAQLQFISPTTPSYSPRSSYYFIDEVVLNESNVAPASFTLPTTICRSSIIQNLSNFIGGNPLNGVFSGSGVSFNSLTGIYSFNPQALPLGISTISFTYTAPANCPTTISRNINIRNTIIQTPTFYPIAPLCEGSSFTLPYISPNEGIMGTWSPAPNFNATTTYTFTPNSQFCANSITMTVVVMPKTTPTFANIAPICSGTLFTLPTTSINGIRGT